MKYSLTLLFPILIRQVIKPIVGMQDVGNHVISFLGHGAFGSAKPYRLDKVCKKTPCMNPATGYLEVFPFPCELVVDLITVRNDGAGEIFQEFSRVVSLSGSLPVVEDDGGVVRKHLLR